MIRNKLFHMDMARSEHRSYGYVLFERRRFNMKKEKRILNIYVTLVLFVIIPLIFTAVALSIILTSASSKKLKSSTHNAMIAFIKEEGAAFDYSVENSKTIMESFSQAPIIAEFLKNPEDETLAAKAEQYTCDFFEQLSGWEGIYLADWNSKVLTHPTAAVVGRVMREGDKLKELQDAMLAAGGVYNVGVISSPASGKLIMSMYAPIYDENKNPIGYIGAGTYVNDVASQFSDVSGLGLSSAYVYFVAPDGTMLYHKDPSKIGNPVENAAVKNVISKIQSGTIPQPECVEYLYKGAMKYAAYYVGDNANYIAVVTADESDALAAIREIQKLAIMVTVFGLIGFVIIALLVARLIASPLGIVAKGIKIMSDGDFKQPVIAKTHIKEIGMLVDSANELQNTMQDIVAEVSSGMNALSNAVDTVAVQVETCNNAKDGISAAVEEMAKGATEMAESVQNNAESMGNIGSSIDAINDIVNETSNKANSVGKITQKAKIDLDELIKANRSTVAATEEVVKGILESSEAVREIENAARAITDIASQTNLLSLNASIEAARAGEAGKGFAVVASEIQKLAQQSDDSAKEIRSIIDNVITTANANTELTNKIKESVENEGSILGAVNNSFDGVETGLSGMIDGINNITDMTNSLNVDKNSVLDEISNLSSISEENAASTQETSASTQELGANIEGINAETVDIVKVVEQVNDAMKFFK